MRRKADRDDRGAAAVEFALISIPLLLLVVAIIQFGLAYQTQVSATQAARSAARYGAICGPTGGCTDAQVQQNALDAAPGTTIDPTRVTVQHCPTGSRPDPTCPPGNCPVGATQSTFFEYVTVPIPFSFTFSKIKDPNTSPLAITITGKASLPCGG